MPIGCGEDGNVVRNCQRRKHSAGHILFPTHFAACHFDGHDLSPGHSKQFFVKANIAARDKDQIARHGRAAPGIHLQRRFPDCASIGGVQAFENALAGFVFINVGAGGDEPVAHQIDGGIHVPRVLSLLPEQFGLGRRKVFIFGRNGQIAVLLFGLGIFGLKFGPFLVHDESDGFWSELIAIQRDLVQINADDAGVSAADVDFSIEERRRAFRGERAWPGKSSLHKGRPVSAAKQ